MSAVIGVDVGHRREPSAVCVAEPDRRPGEVHFLVRHLERLQLGMPYPEVARRVADVTRAVKLRSGNRPHVYADATGLGQPIVELLAKASGAPITAVYFTHGDRRRAEGSRVLTLGKAYLVARLQALLQSARLHLPRTADAEALAQDLLDYEVQVDPAANDRYGAFRVGRHDDLVTALGLAVQDDPATTRRVAIQLGG